MACPHRCVYGQGNSYACRSEACLAELMANELLITVESAHALIRATLMDDQA